MMVAVLCMIGDAMVVRSLAHWYRLRVDAMGYCSWGYCFAYRVPICVRVTPNQERVSKQNPCAVKHPLIIARYGSPGV